MRSIAKPISKIKALISVYLQGLIQLFTDMPKVSLNSGRIDEFIGDAIICPCDFELTYKRANDFVRSILDTGGKKLMDEVSIIGSCNIGNAVITQGYDLKVRNVIFLPHIDQDDPENVMDLRTLHQGLKSAIALASLYELKTLALGFFQIGSPSTNTMESFFDGLLLGKHKPKYKSDEVDNVILSVIKDFERSSITELTIYK